MDDRGWLGIKVAPAGLVAMLFPTPIGSSATVVRLAVGL